jgi:hypothetical protein
MMGNVCERATEHMVECFEAWCVDHADNGMCQAMVDAFDDMPDDFACAGASEAAAAAMLETSCAELLGQMGMVD